MFHYFEAITNTRGDALTGYYVQAVDQATGNTISLYADDNSTPIISVSGVADKAKVDSNGNASFYVGVGTYNLNIYATDSTTLVETVFGVPMLIDEDLAASVVANANAAAASASQAQSYLNSLTSLPTSGLTVTAASRAALALMSTALPATLWESGREGLFVWSSANHATDVTNDPQQAIYVPPSRDTTGTSGAWVRKFSGAKNLRWFGAAIDGTTDDSVALQAWLDSGGNIYHPGGNAKCGTGLIVRRTVHLSGNAYGFDDLRSVAGTLTPSAQITFAAGVAGFDVQPQVTTTTWPAGSATQEGGFNSSIEDIELVGSGGATATGLHSRVTIRLRNVVVTGFSGKGFDISAAANTDATAEYGNASFTTIERCTAQSNGSHGFHIRGADANVIKIDSCNANANSGFGYYDGAEFANLYANCHATSNTLGSYKTAGNATAAHTFVNCYDEGGTGTNCDISSPATVVGGNLAQTASNLSGNNAHSGGALPTIVAGPGYSTFNDLHITWNDWDAGGVGALFSTDKGLISGSSPYGLVLAGNGSTGDISFVNHGNHVTAYVVSNSLDWHFKGAILSIGMGGVGYSTGAGGMVAQATSRTTGVTLNTPTGKITLVSAATTAGQLSQFTLTNSQLGADDTISFTQLSGAGFYIVNAINNGTGAATVSVYTPNAVGAAEAPAFQFNIVKGAQS